MSELSDTPSTRTNLPLLRPEAVNAQLTRFEGTVTLSTRLPTTVLCIVCALIGLGIIAFITQGSYTRRASVTGHLQPTTGVLRVVAPQTGVIVERRVSDGQSVQAGDVLFVINSERISPSGEASGGLGQSVGEQIAQRQRSLQAEISRNRQAHSQEAAHVKNRIQTLQSEAKIVETLIAQQRQRVIVAEDIKQRYQALADKEYIAREQLTQKQVEFSEQESRLQTLLRELSTNRREQEEARREINNLAGRLDAQNASLERGISSGRQELAEVQTRSRLLVTAPADGMATLVAGELGQSVETGRLLLSIVPQGVPLQARLFAPSRHIGFVKENDKVLIRYSAYPYQMFGQHTGRVSSISNAVATPSELSQVGIDAGASTEPVYVISVELDNQTMIVSGQSRALQAGMRLEADLLQEKRKLWQWILEPVYSVTRKATP